VLPDLHDVLKMLRERGLAETIVGLVPRMLRSTPLLRLVRC
jgi:hypothetical protein